MIFSCSVISLPRVREECNHCHMPENEGGVMKKLAAALIVSAVIVVALTIFFLSLAEGFSGATESEDARDIVIALHDTLWQLDTSGRRDFERVFLLEGPKDLIIRRTGDLSFELDFSLISVIVSYRDGYFRGTINGREFLLSVSRSHTGEGEALTFVAGDDLIVFH